MLGSARSEQQSARGGWRAKRHLHKKLNASYLKLKLEAAVLFTNYVAYDRKG